MRLYCAPDGAMQFEVERTLKNNPEAEGSHLWVLGNVNPPHHRMPGCRCKEFILVIKTDNPKFARLEGCTTVCRCMGRFVE